MDIHSTHCTWTGEGLAFDGEVNGNTLRIDGDHEKGLITPKKLTLLSLAGCTAMDVISLLEKMRQEVTYFDVAVEAPVTDEHPRQYTAMKIIYTLRGRGLEEEKVLKAVNMSKERYCGVSALLSKAVPITFEVKLEEEPA